MRPPVKRRETGQGATNGGEPIPTHTLRLIAPGQPVSAKNHMTPYVRGGKMAIRKGEAVTRWYGHAVPALARQWFALGQRTWTGPVCVECHQFLQFAYGHQSNPDTDNVVSAVYDALKKAMIIKDDRQVIAGSPWRHYNAAEPRVEVFIRPATLDEAHAAYCAAVETAKAA